MARPCCCMCEPRTRAEVNVRPRSFFCIRAVFHKSELPHRCITLLGTEQESERQSSIMETIQEEEEAPQEEFTAVAVMSRMQVTAKWKVRDAGV